MQIFNVFEGVATNRRLVVKYRAFELVFMNLKFLHNIPINFLFFFTQMQLGVAMRNYYSKNYCIETCHMIKVHNLMFLVIIHPRLSLTVCSGLLDSGKFPFAMFVLAVFQIGFTP